MQDPELPHVPEPRISHRHLEVFRALMLSGSATAAAQMLYSSQPTVSRELARLESLLGYALFERAQGRLRPTARALSLWAEVQRSWQGLDRVVEHALALGRPHQARINVLCLPALSHALLPAALARLHAEHGPVAVSVATQEAPLLQEWMAAQRYDLGLAELAEAPPGTRALALPAMDEVAVLPAGHALAARPVLEAGDFAGRASSAWRETTPIASRSMPCSSRPACSASCTWRPTAPWRSAPWSSMAWAWPSSIR